MKNNIKEVAWVFLTGFVIGIGCALSCMPQEKEEREPLFQIEGPQDEALDKEVREFISALSEKYHLYRVQVIIKPEGE